MLKLATVFSGIGAIEHALQRMNIEHELVFACDSGGIDPFDKMEEDEVNSIKEDILNTEDFIERKAKVDELYNKKKKTNFVKKSYFANYDIKEEHFHNDVVFLNGNQYIG